MAFSDWSGRLGAIGASANEVSAISGAYQASAAPVQDALDVLVGEISNGELLVMLGNWRASPGPFQLGFPGGGLPFGTGVAVLTGQAADDAYAVGAGTGQRVGLAAAVVTGPPGISATWRGVWAGGTTYTAGPPPDGVLGSNGHWYVSLTSGNIGHDPTTDGGVHWADALPPLVENVSRLVVLPAPSGGDDAADVNARIAGAAAGSLVISAPGTYQMNSAGLVLKGGVSYDFSLSAFPQVSASYSTPLVVNAAQTPTATATDASTTGATWDQWTITAGAATGGSATWSFTWNGLLYTTPAVAFNATLAQVLAAFQAATDPRGLPVPGGSPAFAATGGPLGTNPVVITAGSYTKGPITGLAVAVNSYTGGSAPTFTHTTTGVAPTVGVTSPTLAAVAVIGQTVRVVGAGPAAGPGGVGSADYSGEVQAIAGNVLTLGNIYGSTAPWTTVAGATACLYTRDKAIHVRGGSVTRSVTGSGSEEDRHVIRIRYADDFRWENPSIYSTLSDPNILYGMALGNLRDFTVSGVRGSTSRDGVHLEGSCFRGTVRDVKMTTGDDLVALVTRGFFSAGQTACDGDIFDVSVEDIHSDLGKGIALGAGVSTSILRVTVDGMHGQMGTSGVPIRIQDVPGEPDTGGIYDDIIIRDVDALPDATTSQVILLGATGMRNVTISEHFSGSALTASYGLPVSISGTIESLTLNVPKATTVTANDPWVNVNAGGWVHRLQVNGGRIAFSTGSSFLNINNGGVVVHFAASNLSCSSTNGTGALIASAGTGTLSSAHLSNVRLNNMAWLIDTNLASTLYVSNVECSNMSSGIANVRASGNLRIVGAGFSSNNTTIAVTAGGIASVNCADLQTDATKLTPQTGDRVYNTSTSLPAGVGAVIWDGSYVSLSGSNLYPAAGSTGVPGSFEDSVNMAWFACGHGAATQSAAKAYIGSDSAALTADGTGTLDFRYNHAAFDTVVTAGQMYTFTFYALAASTVRGWQIKVEWFTSGGVFINNVTTGNLGNDNATSWTQFQLNAIAPATAARALMHILTAQTPANGEVHYVDAISEYASTVGLFRPAAKPYFAQWTVPLIAGTATISDSRITANSIFRVSPVGPVAPLGILSVNPGAGSAVVSSTSNTDTATASVELVTP